MKHYLYTDKEFIYSYLSQKGKGLNLSYSQMNKNSSSETESQTTQNNKSLHNIEGEKTGDFKVGGSIEVIKSEYTNGTDFKFNISKNSLREMVEFATTKSDAQSELYNIELHDYLYEIFENTVNETSKSIDLYESTSHTFAELNNEHFEFLKSIADLYTKDKTASFMNIPEDEKSEFKKTKNNLEPVQKIAATIDKLIPGDLKLIFDNNENNTFIGPLYEDNLNIPIKELKYLYKNKTINIIGIQMEEIVEDDEDNASNIFADLQLDTTMSATFMKTLFESKTIYYFKPIIMYINL